MRIERVKRKWLALGAAVILTAGVAAQEKAQDATVPSGRLVFRSSSLEFRPDGTFLAHTVIEGIGEVRAAGTWSAQPGTIELSRYEVLAGAELLASFSMDGCLATGQYRFELSGNQLRLSALRDECLPRALFLDKTRWAPPGEPNLAPPRTLTRTLFDRGVRLPVPDDGSGSWPSFRGPYASGIADGQQFPERWDLGTRENILWRTSIPGLAHSSPIVWGNRLFVTSAISSRGAATFKTGPYSGGDSSDDSSSHRWLLYALDVRTGNVLWEQTAYEGAPRDKRHVKSSYASSTPATDGRVVVAWFGSQGLHAYTVDGKPLWRVDVGRVSVGAAESAGIEWGAASSPVIWNGRLFLQVDTRDDSFVVALSVETGEQVWKTERDETASWSTPTIVTTRSGAELVVNGSNFVRGYDPGTGQERWRVHAGSPIATPTPVKAGELSIVTSGGMGSSRPLVAVRPGASGQLTPAAGAGTTKARSGVAWSVTGRGPFTPTPLAYRGVLYVLANNGVLDAYDVDTGAEIFRARIPEVGSGFSASPVVADGKIYLANEDGAIAVVAAGRAFRHLVTNDIGEPIMATPALSRGVIFVRGMNSVVAIGRQMKH
ncbi:MAG: PQQ-binding-like beta-propeller repeat protein [Candidatus Limnocylindrales bacterium]